MRRRRRPEPLTPSGPYHLLCVLGSGGHTAEMLVLLSDLLKSRTCPAQVTYLATATDDHSLSKARRFHSELSSAREKTLHGRAAPAARFNTIPRAREVGESAASSAASVLRCLSGAAPAVAAAQPDVVLVNGPGSALVVVLAVLVMNAMGLTRARSIYVESVARARSFSLSGKILYYAVDRFVVQWPGLVEKYPMAEFHGRLC